MIAVSASGQPRASQPTDAIGAPRQAAWLTLLPASAAADTAAVVLIVPLVVCLAADDHCRSFVEGYEPSPSKGARRR